LVVAAELEYVSLAAAELAVWLKIQHILYIQDK
jgi:hypothetical protein